MRFSEWQVWDENEERKKKFPGLPWSNPLNMIELADTEKYPPNSIGARQQKRMKNLIETELGSEKDTNPDLVIEALRLSNQVMDGVDSVADLINVARKTIEISSKPF